MSFFLGLFIPASSIAQSYEQLWKKTQEAAERDLPATALENVRQVRQKALAEKNDAQLLRAVLMERIYGGEISPDSAKAIEGQMEAALAGENRPVALGMWHSALAHVFNPSSRWDYDSSVEYESALQKCRGHFKASLSDCEALANAKTTDWLPLLTEGGDSKYFDGDMLHVLFYAWAQSGRAEEEELEETRSSVAALYRRRGNTDAALLLTLDSLRKERQERVVAGRLDGNDLFNQYSALAEKNADSPLCVRIYEEMTDFKHLYGSGSPYAQANDSILVAMAHRGIQLCGGTKAGNQANRLRNFISETGQPSAEIKVYADTYMPGESDRMRLRSRNLRKIGLRMVKLTESRAEYDSWSYKERKAKTAQGRKQAHTTYYDIPSANPWAWQETEKTFTAPAAPGVYQMELVLDGKMYDSFVFSVSSIRPLVFSAQDQPCRVVVVDSHSGRPIPGVKIKAVRNGGKQQARVWTTDIDGEALIEADNSRRNLSYYASTASDKASRSFALPFYGYFHPQESSGKRAGTAVNLFTDRAIYRPGQTVHFSGTVFTRQGDLFKAEPNWEAQATLYNVNRKAVDTLLVKTDEFGTFCGSFTLPAAALPGNFKLEAGNKSVSGTKYIKVEEYKRPTFTAGIQPVATAFALGDTVEVEGLAKTYSGVPVAGAKVKYAIERGRWFWNSDNEEAQTGETVTDNSGKFTIPVCLYANEQERQPLARNCFYYVTSYTVTAENGETAQGTSTLHAAAWKSRLDISVPNMVCKEHLPQFCIRQLNAAGTNIDGDGTFEIVPDVPSASSSQAQMKEKAAARGNIRFGKPFTAEDLKNLPSGKYRLKALSNQEGGSGTFPAGGAPLQGTSESGNEATFILFSEKDTSPAVRDTAFFTFTRESETGDSAHVMVGTPRRDAVLFYDLIANGKTVESARITLSDSIFHLHLSYKPEYGDGAKAFFALVKEDTLYTFEAAVKKPAPDKRLQLRWKTFRSRLVPGQAEEWTLQVTHPDGTPANALVMAGMYDASLDIFAKNEWTFSNMAFSRNLPRANWSQTPSRHRYGYSLNGTKDFKYLATPVRALTAWRDELFSYGYSPKLGASSFRKARTYAAAGSSLEEFAVYDMAEAPAANMSLKAAMADEGSGSTATGGAAEAKVSPRSNFAETAFFLPALHTNGHGETAIAFTLPESMTTWNFSALAHDKAMNNGRLDTTIVARKDFMVEPALPRFVRHGDKTQLPVKVTNLSEKEIKANLILTLENALAEGVYILKEQQPVTLAAGESKVFKFSYEAAAGDAVLICRATASGEGFSDGEEHYLPVLGDLVEVTRTLPFSMTGKGSYSFETDTLFNVQNATNRTLTVELSGNALWTAVTALPALSGSTSCLSATEWAARYYAISLGKHIAEKNPAIRNLVENSPAEVSALSKLKLEGFTDETPWLRNAEANKERTEALKNLFDPELSAAYKATALDKLKDLQQSDGSWSWYPGMPGNNYITVDVAILLARLKAMEADDNAENLLQKAFAYLRNEVAGQVAEMKKDEKRLKTQLLPSELQMRFLYLCSILDKKPDADASFLLERAEKMRKELTMYGKAVSAIVLAKAGREEAAKLNLESLMEHTVNTPEMGRWFDTDRAEWSWKSYRIPTQCAAIEALRHFGEKEECAAMRLWLLQSKRTQMWETPRATADAVFSLLNEQDESSAIGQLEGTKPVYYTLKKGKEIVGFNAPGETQTPQTVGYFKQTYTAPPATEATELLVRKGNEGLSWGSIYASFTVPAEEVENEGKGLSITRRFERQEGTTWKALAKGEKLRQGDRVRQVFALTADRDYDFVSLTASRPACMEPVRALSGYQWNDGLSAYRAVRDDRTQYFIEQVRKGTHLFTEELFVDRSGDYNSGTAEIECVFAPEFRGTAASQPLTAE